VLEAAEYVGAAIGRVVVVFYLVQRCYFRTSRQLRYLDLEAKSPLYSLFLEALRGRATVRAFRWQDECQAEFLSALDDLQRPAYLLASVQQWLALVLGLSTAAVAVILVALVVTSKRKGHDNGKTRRRGATKHEVIVAKPDARRCDVNQTQDFDQFCGKNQGLCRADACRSHVP
jgi:ABC-type multidrug transport system fused ATPase/permease subunit